jgi:hypothetical protein
VCRSRLPSIARPSEVLTRRVSRGNLDKFCVFENERGNQESIVTVFPVNCELPSAGHGCASIPWNLVKPIKRASVDAPSWVFLSKG